MGKLSKVELIKVPTFVRRMRMNMYIRGGKSGMGGEVRSIGEIEGRKKERKRKKERIDEGGSEG